ncbi:transglycosylase domain-containing protein [Actinomyces minihominis]|uniref:transglycosylase domain-containing protein n=1 Tax=Actinomyces minihominis TaxID=2002838 RepID=UPI000C06AD3A|nr:transglycosylase domain-containing protein [Actinomyces minihominis]
MADNNQFGSRSDEGGTESVQPASSVPPPPVGSRSARHRKGGQSPLPEDPTPKTDEAPTRSTLASRFQDLSTPGGDGEQSGQTPSGRPAAPAPLAEDLDVPGIVSPRFDDGGEEGGEAVAKKKRKWPKRLALGLVAAIALMIILGGAFFMWAYSRVSIPQPTEFALAQTTVVYYNDGETELGRFSEVNRTIIDVAELPDYVTQAVIASEDRTFYTNSGVDIKGIARAAINNLRGGARQGASTLSQQYVENYYIGNPTKTYLDKMEEALIALKINRNQTKEEILENYMNTIYFGRNAYGIEAASEAYFGKPAVQMTLSEAAMLSGIIPAPNAWDPAFDPDMAQERWARVLDLMVQEGYISEAEAAAQTFPETIPPETLQASNQLTGWSGYLLQQVKQELLDTGSFTEEEIYEGGLNITSTLNQAQQQAAVDAVAILPEDTPDSVQVALSSVDNATGEIVAEYAGGDYAVRQINSVTQETAMAGSTFKPFALIPYVEQGNSLYREFDGNSPQDFMGLTVQNVNNYSYGKINVIEATAVSSNTVYVAMNELITPSQFMNTVVQAGLPEDTPGLEPTLLNILGSASPTNLQMSRAFATLANGGEKIDPHIVRSVADSRGNEVYKAPTPRERVFSTETMSKAMPAIMAPVEDGGSAEKVAALGRIAGGKTGTSEETKSALFAGFVPQYTTVVSMFNVGEGGAVLPLPPIGDVWSVHGSDWPTDIWVAYMAKALEGVPVLDFSWFDKTLVDKKPEIPQSRPKPVEKPEVKPEPTPQPEPTPEPEPEPDPEPGQSGEGTTEGGGSNDTGNAS